MGENIIRNTIITVLLFVGIMIGFGAVYTDSIKAYGPDGLDTITLDNASQQIWLELGNQSKTNDANTTYDGMYQTVMKQNDTWEEDFEANMFKTTLQGGKSSVSSYKAASYLIKSIGIHLRFPAWVWLTFSSVLVVLFIFAILKFFRTGAEF